MFAAKFWSLGSLGGLLVGCVGGAPGSNAPPIVSQPGPVEHVGEPPVATPGTHFAEPPAPAQPPGPLDGQGGPISTALAAVPSAVAANYVLSLSADRGELTIDPRPQAERRSRDRSGFEVKDSANGGKIITLVGGPFKTGKWVRSSFREQVADGQLAELRRSSYDVEQVRDLLVVQGERDATPTVFAFSADANKPGIVGICSEVTIVDFGAGANNANVAVRKPVIYLYPERTMEVRVDVDIDGEFVAVYPPMGGDGWQVTARPDGRLVDRATGRGHRYLFWEGTSRGFDIDPRRAHCVAAADSAGFLERACGRFALTEEECGDFVTYWLPALGRSKYNVIQFVDEEVYERYARMRVEPRPDTVVRQFMIFRGSDVPVEVGAPELAQRTRRGFTVVEWGGAEVGAVGAGKLEIR